MMKDPNVRLYRAMSDVARTLSILGEQGVPVLNVIVQTPDNQPTSATVQVAGIGQLNWRETGQRTDENGQFYCYETNLNGVKLTREARR